MRFEIKHLFFPNSIRFSQLFNVFSTNTVQTIINSRVCFFIVNAKIILKPNYFLKILFGASKKTTICFDCLSEYEKEWIDVLMLTGIPFYFCLVLFY